MALFGKKKDDLKELKPPKEKKSFFRKKKDLADTYMDESGEITSVEQESSVQEETAANEPPVTSLPETEPVKAEEMQPVQEEEEQSKPVEEALDLSMEETAVDAVESEQTEQKEVPKASLSSDEEIFQVARNVDALDQDELEQLLNAAAEADEEFDNFDYIENVDVYTQATEADKEQLEKKAEEHFNVSEVEKISPLAGSGGEGGLSAKGMPLEKVSMKALLSVAGIMLVLVIFFTTLLVIQTKRYNQGRIYAQETGLLVAQSEVLGNNANYVYVSQHQEIGGKNIELSKIAFSPVESVFYFRGDFRSDQYDFILIDDQDRFYMMDWGFYQYEDTGEGEFNETVVRFEPVEEDVKYVVLTLRNTGNAESADFQIMFDTPIVWTPVRYVSYPAKGEIELDGVDVVVNEGIFASTGSTVTYALTWEDESEVLRQDYVRQLAGDEYVTLLEKGRSISNTKNYPAEYLFEEEKVILGRMDYIPVNDLNAKAEVQFNNLQKVIEVNETVDVGKLFQNNEESQIEIVKGRYKIVLERMGSVRDQYILVYHIEDRWIPIAPGSTNNRIYSLLDTTLIYTSPEGIQVPLSGYPMAKAEGGDIQYRKGSYQEFLPESGIGANMAVEIHTMNIQVEPVSVALDLERASTVPLTTDLSIAKEDILTGFHNRLAYKSSEISKNSIQYIDNALLNQQSLMREYEPETGLDSVVYGARIVTSHVDGNASYFIVEETWRGTKGQTETVFYRTHKVVAELRGTQWVITKDTIIK